METHSKPLKIIILSDGKKGHLNQSLAVAQLIHHATIQIVPITYKSRFHQFLLDILTYFLRNKKIYTSLLYFSLTDPAPMEAGIKPEKGGIVISAGSSLCSLNFALSKILAAKSIVIMKPLCGFNYDLQIIPKHDHPPKNLKTVVTLGAPTIISELNLAPYAQKLASSLKPSHRHMISVFIGGNSKYHCLTSQITDTLIQKLDQICHLKNMDLLITTSRRTPLNSIQKIKTHFLHHPYCRLLMIPTESSQPEHVPEHLIEGMLGLASLVLVTQDSVSMISEAASSGKKVMVIEIEPLKKHTKHKDMLKTLVQEGYVSTCPPGTLDKAVIEKLADETPVKRLQDSAHIRPALQRLLSK